MAPMQSIDGEDGWYVRDLGNQPAQLWRIAEGTATLAGVTNPEAGAGTYYKADPGETVWDSIRRNTPWLEGAASTGPFRRMHRGPGEYYPRMARPFALMKTDKLWLPDIATERRYLAGAQNHLASLVRQLEAICRVVQPAPCNLAVYGHEIRNLLILCATEVEMHGRGILAANGLVLDRYSTNDYVRLAAPMRLADYRVHFHACPDLDPVAPFATWDAKAPTQSLGWYDAYNAVKHNREHAFERASLGNGLAAIAACEVLLEAQFGKEARTADLASFLNVEAPDWPIEESYLSPDGEQEWSPISHPDLA